MIIGVDVGYSHVKTSAGVLFPALTRESDALSEDDLKYWIDGKNYDVGVGCNALDVNKINLEITKVLLFASLAKSSSENSFNVVTGLPIAQFKSQGAQFKDSILKQRRATVRHMGADRLITIQDVKVYAQGAGALYAQQINGDAIIIDIGGRTVDIAYFKVVGGKRVLADYSTLYCGTLLLYAKVAQELNKQYDLTLNYIDAEKILTDGLVVDGERQDIKFIESILQRHIAPILDDLALKYPYRITPIYLCGGGAIALAAPLKQHLKGATLLNNPQFCNAKGFGKVGEKVWQPSPR